MYASEADPPDPNIAMEFKQRTERFALIISEDLHNGWKPSEHEYDVHCIKIYRECVVKLTRKGDPSKRSPAKAVDGAKDAEHGFEVGSE